MSECVRVRVVVVVVVVWARRSETLRMSNRSNGADRGGTHGPDRKERARFDLLRLSSL